MHLTTRTLLTHEVIQQRLMSLAERISVQLLAHEQGIGRLTLLSVTQSSQLLLQTFAGYLSQRGYELTVLMIPPEVSAKWVLEHQDAWDGACILFQDVSSTGQTLKSIQAALVPLLDIPVLSCCMFQKWSGETGVHMADFIGYSIPDEFIVGCGLEANGQFQERMDVSVLI